MAPIIGFDDPLVNWLRYVLNNFDHQVVRNESQNAYLETTLEEENLDNIKSTEEYEVD
ncbi:MAG: hypothetical protein OQK78_09585 [Gammaproteobacteria bacterium]|nr:hypothetical protein [Gammaproteobacteria bacterium]MCW8888998.1 hypothetical protein [Gammaproteobacteria bacterium]